MLSDIEISQLRRFNAIVETGSFVEAARRLNITQQALSASIAKLEDTAGVRFLERKRGSSVHMTAFGRLLLARGRSYLALSDRLTSEIELLRDARGGSVTVGIGETMTGRPVAAAIRRFNRQRPDVQLSLIEGYTESFSERLLSGELDFVIGGPSYEQNQFNDLRVQHLFETRDVLAVRSQHPLVGVPNVGLRELAAYPWIVPGYRGDVYKAIQLAYMKARIAPPVRVVQSDAIALGTWLCLDDDYVVSVSPDLVGAWIAMGALTTLDCQETTLTRPACAITRRHDRLAPAAEMLLNEILREYDGSGASVAGF